MKTFWKVIRTLRKWLVIAMAVALGALLMELLKLHPDFDRGAVGALILGCWFIWWLIGQVRDFWRASR